MSNAREFWTAERVALLRRLRDDGVAYAAIAARLGVSRNAISGKVDRLGLSVRERVPRAPRQPRPVLRRRPVAANAYPPALGAPAVSAAEAEAVPMSAMLELATNEPVGLRSAREGDRSANGPVGVSASTSSACGLLELDERTCRWPVGDPGEPDFFFCGEVPAGRGPYCAAHRRLAYRPFDTKPLSEFEPDRDASRVMQPDTRFGQFADWDVT